MIAEYLGGEVHGRQLFEKLVPCPLLARTAGHIEWLEDRKKLEKVQLSVGHGLGLHELWNSAADAIYVLRQ